MLLFESRYLSNSVGRLSRLSGFNSGRITVDSILRAVLDNVALCTTSVAGFGIRQQQDWMDKWGEMLTLSSSVKGTAIGRGAVLGNVTELSASVALRSLGLTVPSEVVGSSTTVALRDVSLCCDLETC